MSEKTTRTKAELLKMLAEAVRNTQPQPVDNTAEVEPARDVPSAPKSNRRPVSKQAAKTKAETKKPGRKKLRR